MEARYIVFKAGKKMETMKGNKLESCHCDLNVEACYCYQHV